MDNIEYECPVCNVKLNSRKEPFASVRAVALHIAARIKGNDTDHKIWAYENRGEEEIDKAITLVKAKDDINELAKLLLLPVNKWCNEKSKPNIGFKKHK
ncbi:MAG: hypothetical protein A2Z29_05635 [Chloroflexi bacterium RBG_16_56_11]|nr:MAG: hypothetical protein A2Z29_05635 [Chloroflexi bacterium RBG_16_56_11]